MLFRSHCRDLEKGIQSTDGGAIHQGARETFSAVRQIVTDSGLKDRKQLQKMGQIVIVEEREVKNNKLTAGSYDGRKEK